MTISGEIIAVIEEASGLAGLVEQPCLLRGLRRFATGGADPEDLLDELVDQVDADISSVVDAVLHHPRFLALERIYRATWLLVSRAPRAENIRCELLNVSKEDLIYDFDDAPELGKSALFKTMYWGEYGPFGGRPFAAAILDYEFAATPQDIALLRKCADVVHMAAGVMIAGVHESLLARRDAQDLAAHGPGEPTGVAAQWAAFRASDAAFTTGLTPHRLLGRPAYGARKPRSFKYVETTHSPADHPWIGGAFAIGGCLAASFARYRTAARITGAEDGAVGGPGRWRGPDGDWPSACALELRVDAAGASAIAAAGFIPLVADPESGEARCLEAPNACAEAPASTKGLDEEDRALHRRLTTAIFITRVVMHTKVIQREMIGSWCEREQLASELRSWVSQLQHGEAGLFRAVEVDLLSDEPRWFPYLLRVTTGYLVEGRHATLAFANRLDRE